MNEYQQNVVQEYCRAILKAERLLKEAEHDGWTVEETKDLYEVSCCLREALNKLQEGMSQALYTAQESE